MGLGIAAFGLSVDNYEFLNGAGGIFGTEGVLDLGNRDVRTTGTIFAEAAELGVGTIRITDTGIEQKNTGPDSSIVLKGPGDKGTFLNIPVVEDGDILQLKFYHLLYSRVVNNSHFYSTKIYHWILHILLKQ